MSFSLSEKTIFFELLITIHPSLALRLLLEPRCCSISPCYHDPKKISTHSEPSKTKVAPFSSIGTPVVPPPVATVTCE